MTQYGSLHNGNSVSWFKVETKSGEIMEYGRTDNARITRDPRPGYSNIQTGTGYKKPSFSTGMVWMNNRVSDTVGNYMDFVYRVSSGSEHLLDRIDYTGNINTGLAPYNSVRFVYDETRPDAREVFSAGQKIHNKSRLIRIETFADNQTIRRYSLSYQTSQNLQRSQLVSLQECAQGNNQWDCVPATTFEWQQNLSGFSQVYNMRPPMGSSEGDGDPISQSIDLNGDGLLDWVGHSDERLDTWINTGSSWQSTPNYRLPIRIYYQNQAHGELVDINGDGLPDYIYSHGGAQPKAWINTGSTWQSNDRYALPSNSNGHPYLFDKDGNRSGMMIDIDGDGLNDFVRSRNKRYESVWINKSDERANCTGHACIWQETLSYKLPRFMFENSKQRNGDLIDLNGDGLVDYLIGEYSTETVFTGNGFEVETIDNTVLKAWLNTGSGWQEAGYYNPPRFIHWDFRRMVEYTDLNGDGLVDLLYNYNGGHTPYLNTGRGWVEDARYTVPKEMGRKRKPMGFVQDVNGDNLPDLVYSRRKRTYEVYLNQSSTHCTTPKCMWVKSTAYTPPVALISGNDADVLGYLQDFNGDGLADFAFAGQTNHQSSNASLHLNRATATPSISTITNGLGSQITLQYGVLSQPSAGVYTKFPNGHEMNYPTMTYCAPVPVVKEHKSSNGIGGWNGSRYHYGGGRVDMLGRGLLGFETFKVTDIQTGDTDTTTFRQDYPYIGQVDKTETRLGNGKLVNSSTTTYATRTLGSGSSTRLFPYASVVVSTNYEIDTANTAVKSSRSEYQYDNYGNATLVRVKTYPGTYQFSSQGHTVTTTSSFTNNTSQWHLGRLSASTVTHQAASGNTQTRRSSFTYDTNGLLKTEVVEPGSSLSLQTTHYYDSFGNKVRAAITGSGQTRNSYTTYDNRGQFATSSRNALSHTETYTFDPKNGNRLSMTGPNNLTTRWEYDAFGRPTKEIRADGTWTQTNRSTHSDPSISIQVTATTSSGGESHIFYDILEREVQTQSRGFDGRWLIKQKQYDSIGRQFRSSMPFYEGQPTFWSAVHYDAANRVIKTTSPLDDRTGQVIEVRAEYAGFITRQIDANGRTTEQESDVRGKTIRVTDSQNNTVRHEYDAIGNLTKTIDPAGNMITLSYNVRNQKTNQSDPDLGNWSYTYNAFDELISQTDAKGQTVTLTYDTLGRLARRDEPEGTTQWYFDSRWKGAMWKVTAPDGYQQETTFDSLGRPTLSRTRIDNVNYDVRNSYDNQSRVDEKTYPTGFKVRHAYNTRGYLELVRDASSNAILWEAEHVDVWGNVDNFKYGNYSTNYISYDTARGHINQIASFNAVTDIQQLNYEWDKVGNLISRQDEHQSNLEERFTYDSLYRLTRSTLYGQENLSLNYDAVGNITYKSDVGSYSYGSRPHAVASTSGSRNESYQYDANGNLSMSSSSLVEWTSFNKPKKIVKFLSSTTGVQQNSNAMTVPAPDVDPTPGTIPEGHLYVPITDQDGSFTAKWGKVSKDECVPVLCYTTSIYQLQVSKNENFSDAQVIFSGRNDSREHVLKNLPSGNYYFRVRNQVCRVIDLFGCDEEWSSWYEFGQHNVIVGQKIAAPGTPVAGTPSGQIINNASDFYYGPNRARYKQVQTKTDNNLGKTTTINYIGGLYEKHSTTGSVTSTEHRHFISAGGQVFAIKTTGSKNTLHYLHRDHLGSVDVITDSTGNIVEKLSYDAFGKRRNAIWTADPKDIQLYQTEQTTNRGYTGHEHLDHVGLIHMNGRVYDPTLGRFLSADPHIQFPHSTQGYNRYTYVNNNPLSYTDPSGFFLKKLFKSVKNELRRWERDFRHEIRREGSYLGAAINVIAAIVSVAVCQGAAGVCYAGIAIAAGTAGGVARAQGATDKDALRAGAIAGTSAYVSGQIGDFYKGSTSTTVIINRAVTHGLAQGAISELSGGDFKNGFASGFFSSVAGNTVLKGIKGDGASAVAGRIIAAAIIGGTASKLSGGKFANGAISGAFVQAFNDELHKDGRLDKKEVIKRVRNEFSENETLLEAVSLAVDQVNNLGGVSKLNGGFYVSLSGGAVFGSSALVILAPNTISLYLGFGPAIGASGSAGMGLTSFSGFGDSTSHSGLTARISGSAGLAGSGRVSGTLSQGGAGLFGGLGTGAGRAASITIGWTHVIRY